MAISLRYRVHEWLADRITWVQYPRIRPNSAAFKFKMPLLHRVALVLWGIALSGVGLALLGFGLFVSVVLLRAVFS